MNSTLLTEVGFFWIFIYWFLLFFAFIGALVGYWPATRTAREFGILGSNLFLLIMLAIIGYAALGFPK